VACGQCERQGVGRQVWVCPTRGGSWRNRGTMWPGLPEEEGTCQSPQAAPAGRVLAGSKEWVRAPRRVTVAGVSDCLYAGTCPREPSSFHSPRSWVPGAPGWVGGLRQPGLRLPPRGPKRARGGARRQVRSGRAQRVRVRARSIAGRGSSRYRVGARDGEKRQRPRSPGAPRSRPLSWVWLPPGLAATPAAGSMATW
jgi:hypothetical protein